jgi:hypothetical protein
MPHHPALWLQPTWQPLPLALSIPAHVPPDRSPPPSWPRPSSTEAPAPLPSPTHGATEPLPHLPFSPLFSSAPCRAPAPPFFPISASTGRTLRASLLYWHHERLPRSLAPPPPHHGLLSSSMTPSLHRNHVMDPPPPPFLPLR